MKYNIKTCSWILTLICGLIFLQNMTLRAESSMPEIASKSHIPTQDETNNDLFLTIDSMPLSADFENILFARDDDFDKIMCRVVKAQFHKIPNSSWGALSDCCVRWSDYATYLTSVASVPDSKIEKELYTDDVAKYIVRTKELHPITGSIFSHDGYFYAVRKGYAEETALLGAVAAKRYLNWRNMHTYLYSALKEEEAITHGAPIDTKKDDHITTVLKNKGCYPVVDIVQNIDHIDEILGMSTVLGCYDFEKNGDSSKTRDHENAIFSLPTQEQKKSWNAQYGNYDSAKQEIWTAESIEKSTNSREKYALQLMLNHDRMLQSDWAKEEEQKLQSSLHLVQGNLALLASSAEYQNASTSEKRSMLSDTLSNVYREVLVTAGACTMVTSIGELFLIGSSRCFICEDLLNDFALRYIDRTCFISDTPIVSDGVNIVMERDEYGTSRFSYAISRRMSLERLCKNGHMSMEVINEANAILRTEGVGLIGENDIASLLNNNFESLFTSNANLAEGDNKVIALLRVFKRKNNWRRAGYTSAALTTFLIYYFGNASNIEHNY